MCRSYSHNSLFLEGSGYFRAGGRIHSTKLTATPSLSKQCPSEVLTTRTGSCSRAEVNCFAVVVTDELRNGYCNIVLYFVQHFTAGFSCKHLHHLHKSSSVNTVRRAIQKRCFNLCCAKRKENVNTIMKRCHISLEQSSSQWRQIKVWQFLLSTKEEREMLFISTQLRAPPLW